MELWLDQIRENNLFRMAFPASQEEIEAAENKLGLTFASEYKEFLSSVGACVCFQHEIKGITDNVTLNVVSATEEARKELDMIPHAWYVIEDTHIDGIVILQDKNGSIYQMAPDRSPMKIADKLEYYLIHPTEPATTKSMNNDYDAASLNEKAQTVINQVSAIAEEKLKDPDRVEKILQQMEKNLGKIPGVGDWLADVPAVISLIRSYIRKEYKDVPIGSIIAGLAAIIYVVSPIDIIPDFIPGVGMLDDAAVFVACWKMIHDDVDKYQAWRKLTGKEIV